MPTTPSPDPDPLRPPRPEVDAREGRGIQAGDHNVQQNYFAGRAGTEFCEDHGHPVAGRCVVCDRLVCAGDLTTPVRVEPFRLSGDRAHRLRSYLRTLTDRAICPACRTGLAGDFVAARPALALPASSDEADAVLRFTPDVWETRYGPDQLRDFRRRVLTRFATDPAFRGELATRVRARLQGSGVIVSRTVRSHEIGLSYGRSQTVVDEWEEWEIGPGGDVVARRYDTVQRWGRERRRPLGEHPVRPSAEVLDTLYRAYQLGHPWPDAPATIHPWP